MAYIARSVVPLTLFTCAFAAASHLRAASLIPLGHLPSAFQQSEAKAVTPDGKVVVGYSRSGDGFEAFRWTAQGGMVGLGDLPGGNFESDASSVSADGNVIVGTAFSTNTPGNYEAFYWTVAEGMKRLSTTLPPGFGGTRANGVSADSKVVVGGGISVIGHDEYGSIAFRWTAETGIVLLGDVPGGIEYSAAHAVSADGNVVIGSGAPAEGGEAFRWTPSTGLVGLGYVSGSPFTASAGTTVSADGRVVAGFAFTTNSPLEAIRWTVQEGMVPLGDLPQGDFRSVARGVSNDGTVIVGEGAESSEEATIWRSGAGAQRLWDHLLALGVNPAADGWSYLASAAAVSPDGRFVVGWGHRNGRNEAFLADLELRLEATRTPDGLSLRLAWPPGLRLERTSTLSPPDWTEVQGANSPLLVPILGNQFYFRIRTQ